MTEKYAPYKTIFEKHEGILRAAEAIRLGMPEHVIYEMVKQGELVRDGRGIYRLAESEMPSDPDLVHVSLRVPEAGICLISALHS